MITLNRKFFKNCYCRFPSENIIISSLVTQYIVDSKSQEIQRIISLSVILHYIHYFHSNLKMPSRYKVMCGCEYCISAKSTHSSLLSWRDRYFKKSGIKYKILKTEGLEKKKTTYTKHIQIRSFHMCVIFTPTQMVWKRKKCVRIHSQIIHYLTLEMCHVILCQISKC